MAETNDSNDETVWTPIQFIDLPAWRKYAIVVLNRPILLPKNVLLPLWEKAKVTVTVDGGTDRWMEYLGESAREVYNGTREAYVPDFISGDQDSILPETREKLNRVGSKILVTPNQDETDYTKALYELSRHCQYQNLQLDGVYVIVDSSGRLDHIIGNLNTLHKVPQSFVNTQVIQVASDSLTWLLRPGKHRIIIPKALVRAQTWCGIIPMRGKLQKVSSTGLKWNLDNLTMEFGGLISTSNTYDENCTEVKIALDDRIIWTMGIEPMLNPDDA